MKFREIEPGMVISWKTEDEKAALLEELERLGYEWYRTKRKPTEACDGKYVGHAIYVYNDSGYKYITHSNNLREVTHEFSDLIITELELSADEALMLRGAICEEKNCGYCPLSKSNNGEGETCNKFLKNHPGKAVELLAKWKSDNEKKEPEIEWVYRVFGAENNGEKFFQTEEEAIKRCEELAKSQKSKQYARYERVCRVKAVE